MAAELKHLAQLLEQQGYKEAAEHLRQEAYQFNREGLIPGALSSSQKPQITLQELAVRVYSLGNFLSQYPEDWKDFYFDDKSITLMADQEDWRNIERKVVLHSLDSWIPTDLGSGGICFEANIEPWRREEVKRLGVDTPHLVANGLHMEERSREQALALVEQDEDNRSRFETSYFIDKKGNIAKLSLMPIEIDLRPDIFNQPIRSLGLKRIRSEVTQADLMVIDTALYIFESKIPRT